MAKRDRERQVAERRKQKAAERAENRQRPTSQRDSDVDPDIAGIVAGPQPLQDWQRADEE